MLENLMRWARVRGLVEGLMQKGRVEGLPNDARDDAQRPQDYGFAGNPVDGEALRLEIGGHVVIIRLDRMAERPELAAYEVAVWHKEGHRITLRDDGVVDVDCTTLNITASGAVAITSASLTHNGKNVGATHTHGGVTAGPSATGVPT